MSIREDNLYVIDRNILLSDGHRFMPRSRVRIALFYPRPEGRGSYILILTVVAVGWRLSAMIRWFVYVTLEQTNVHYLGSRVAFWHLSGNFFGKISNITGKSEKSLYKSTFLISMISVLLCKETQVASLVTSYPLMFCIF